MEASPDARPVAPCDAVSLYTLLGRCVVRIDDGGAFRGSGFFVAPGEVLTCVSPALMLFTAAPTLG